MYFLWKWKFIYLIESVLYPRLNLCVLSLIYNQSDFCDQWFSVLLDSYIKRRYLEFFLTISLREKFSNTEFFLVRIFPHSDWIRSLRIAKCEKNTDHKKHRIWTLFTQYFISAGKDLTTLNNIYCEGAK